MRRAWWQEPARWQLRRNRRSQVIATHMTTMFFKTDLSHPAIQFHDSRCSIFCTSTLAHGAAQRLY
jgi:hypothetical protein